MRDGAASGAWNMAVDEALLLAQLDQSTLDALPEPVLRFYDWQPSCLSLGRLQKVDAKYFENPNLDIVRRPTGGRAVWHQHEITYCAVLRAELLPAGLTSVVGSYRWLSEGFLAGLKLLGVAARLSDGGQSTLCAQSTLTQGDKIPAKNQNCFGSAAQCDAVVDNRKLIGAAQCRKNIAGRTAILQHGSLLLDIDSVAWSRAMNAIGQNAMGMENVIALRELGIGDSRDAIISILCEGMARTHDVVWKKTELIAPENIVAQQLYNEKYRDCGWNRDAIEVKSDSLLPSGVARNS